MTCTRVSVITVYQSVVARGMLNSVQEQAGYVPVYINFSAQTSSARTQEIIESKLEKKRKNILGISTQTYKHLHAQVSTVYTVI